MQRHKEKQQLLVQLKKAAEACYIEHAAQKVRKAAEAKEKEKAKKRRLVKEKKKKKQMKYWPIEFWAQITMEV